MCGAEMQLMVSTAIALVLSLVLTAAILLLFGRRLFNIWLDNSLIRLLKDSYRENLWALIVGTTRLTPTLLLELELRAESREMLERPLGSIVRSPMLMEIAFNPAQIITKPLQPSAKVDTSVVIGPRAARPLQLETPIILGAMSYAIGVSKQFSLAIARGAMMGGTAFNVGSGPVLPEVFEQGGPVIMQYAGGEWTRKTDQLAKADMIEIRAGHGARVALGREIKAALLPEEARQLLNVGRDELLVARAGLPVEDLKQLRLLVSNLREWIRGGPVGFKLAATHQLEKEMVICLEAGADFIAIDGAEGGTFSTPPIIADDFGIPTAHALQRAAQLIESVGMRNEVSLIISGGLRTPGEMLKAMALGADAVYCGTAAMMATTHGQLSISVPFEPITTMVWARGKNAHKFDVAKGAETLANFLSSSTLEMAEAARALGKDSLRQINRQDLIARTKEAAELFQLPLTWGPS